jgi:hypothetical protein
LARQGHNRAPTDCQQKFYPMLLNMRYRQGKILSASFSLKTVLKKSAQSTAAPPASVLIKEVYFCFSCTIA